MNPINPVPAGIDYTATIGFGIVTLIVIAAAFFGARYLRSFDDKFKAIAEDFKDVRELLKKWDSRWERVIKLETEHDMQMGKGGRHYEVD